MRNRLIHAAAILTLAAAALPAGGDVVVLIGGEQLVGVVRPATVDGVEGYEVTAEDGETRFVARDEVERLLLGRDEPTEADDPATRMSSPERRRLEALRRGVADLDDLPTIIARFEAFAGRVDDPDVRAEAEAELAEYRERLAGGYVKLGDRWVSPAERDRLLSSALGDVNEARQAVNVGDGSARDLATALLDGPATAAAGHYLLGVLDFDAGELASARQHFQRVREIEPRHAPTLVNLAAIQTRLGRADRAMWFVAEALDAAPGRAEVVDNALEAVRLLDAESRGDRNAERAAALLQVQEADLQREMADRGLYRWGSDWIGEEEYRQLEEERQEYQGQIDQLRAAYEQAEARAVEIDRRIADNERYMRQLRAQYVSRDANGNAVQLPLPPAFYAAQRENVTLQSERQMLAAEAQGYERQASVLRQQMPQPTFKGELTPIGADGVPVQVAGNGP